MDNSNVHAFGGDGFGYHRVENYTWAGVYDFIECPAKAAVIEVFSGDSIAEEFLGIFVLEKSDSRYRLSSGKQIHDEAGNQQSRRDGSLLLIPLNGLINNFEQTALPTDRVNHGKRPGYKVF